MSRATIFTRTECRCYRVKLRPNLVLCVTIKIYLGNKELYTVWIVYTATHLLLELTV